MVWSAPVDLCCRPVEPVVVGIAGGSGSGKTTLARALGATVSTPVAHLAFDSYYRDQGHLDLASRARVNYDHPNSLDVERFIDDLSALRGGSSIAAPVYDFATHTRSEVIDLVEPHPVVIVDGILLLVFAEVVELLDVAVFVDVTDPVRTNRRVQRDVAERGRTPDQALEQIDRTVRPMFGEFVHPSRERASLIVDGTADPHASASRLADLLSSRVDA